MDHSKLVYCIEGSVFDVIVDLRVGSPTFGMFDTFTLSAETANILYIPRGLAHGFCSNTQVSTMIYKTSTVHDVESDTGILWNSLAKEFHNIPVSDSTSCTVEVLYIIVET